MATLVSEISVSPQEQSQQLIRQIQQLLQQPQQGQPGQLGQQRLQGLGGGQGQQQGQPGQLGQQQPGQHPLQQLLGLASLQELLSPLQGLIDQLLMLLQRLLQGSGSQPGLQQILAAAGLQGLLGGQGQGGQQQQPGQGGLSNLKPSGAYD